MQLQLQLRQADVRLHVYMYTRTFTGTSACTSLRFLTCTRVALRFCFTRAGFQFQSLRECADLRMEVRDDAEVVLC